MPANGSSLLLLDLLDKIDHHLPCADGDAEHSRRVPTRRCSPRPSDGSGEAA